MVVSRSVTHGHSRGGVLSSEYVSWYNMITRCTSENYNEYEHYGGRGIKVCDRWLYSFENFLLDMGLKPTWDHSTERVDVNGDYTPENCVWATRTEQLRNKQLYKNNKSGVKGVFWDRTHEKWVALIGVLGKQVRLGTYKNIEEAKLARRQAEIKYWNKRPS